MKNRQPARNILAARGFPPGGGVIYPVRTASGVLVEVDSLANLAPVNSAGNFLPVAVGPGTITAQRVLRATAARPTATRPAAIR